jgi:hypothetical protein
MAFDRNVHSDVTRQLSFPDSILGGNIQNQSKLCPDNFIRAYSLSAILFSSVAGYKPSIFGL